MHFGVALNGAVGIPEARSGEEYLGLAARLPGRIGDRAIEPFHFGSKLVLGPMQPDMPVHIDAALAEVAVSSDMVEMTLQVDHLHAISAAHRPGVTVNSRGGERARAGV